MWLNFSPNHKLPQQRALGICLQKKKKKKSEFIEEVRGRRSEEKRKYSNAPNDNIPDSEPKMVNLGNFCV